MLRSCCKIWKVCQAHDRHERLELPRLILQHIPIFSACMFTNGAVQSLAIELTSRFARKEQGDKSGVLGYFFLIDQLPKTSDLPKSVVDCFDYQVDKTQTYLVCLVSQGASLKHTVRVQEPTGRPMWALRMRMT